MLTPAYFNSSRPGKQRRTVDLRLCDVKALHDLFLEEWDDWVDRAPHAWKTDRFLLDNTPVAIALMYGQNQQILHPDMVDVEARNWKRDRSYAHIKLFRFSIATHIKSVLRRSLPSFSFADTSFLQSHGGPGVERRARPSACRCQPSRLRQS